MPRLHWVCPLSPASVVPLCPHNGGHPGRPLHRHAPVDALWAATCVEGTPAGTHTTHVPRLATSSVADPIAERLEACCRGAVPPTRDTQSVDSKEEEKWLAIQSGQTQLTWGLWSAHIEHSDALTPAGKRAVRGMVDTIAEYLGDDWLARFLPGESRRSRAVLPLLSWHWWPTNDVPHVYARLLELGSKLRLLHDCPGIADLRRNMRRDLGQFAHSLLQLEVGGLATRSGWGVTFEPGVRDEGGHTDLFLAKGEDAMLVEVKGFLLDKQSSEDLTFSRRVSMALLGIESREQVTFEGEIEPGVDDDKLAAWLEEVAFLAANVARSGLLIETTPSSGGRLLIRPGWPMTGAGHSITIRHGDEWRRITTAVKMKAEQGRGDHPLWLRFDETSQFWALAVPPSYPRRHLHERLARGLSAALEPFAHVAGIVLSSAPTAGSTVGTEDTWEHLDGRATSTVCTTHPAFWRESIIVAGPNKAATRQRAEWSSWYATERSWLDWALDRLGVPPIADLVRPTSPPETQSG